MTTQEEIHLQVLRIVEDRPDITQRALADELGVSLGKANYCLKALLEKGWIKARNFKNSKHKLAYSYLLTPSGIDAKARMTYAFLKRKLEEYEALKAEIDLLSSELLETGGGNPKKTG